MSVGTCYAPTIARNIAPAGIKRQILTPNLVRRRLDRLSSVDGSMPSSVIRAFDYDPEDRRLHVRFVSGRRYSYLDVPAETYDRMRAARSKGEFFNAEIRDRFAFVRDER